MNHDRRKPPIPFRSTHYVQQSYLPLLEGLSCQVSPAGSLEQRDVPPGLNIPLLLQPGKSPRSEEHLQEVGEELR